jgi:hypothetical protein
VVHSLLGKYGSDEEDKVRQSLVAVLTIVLCLLMAATFAEASPISQEVLYEITSPRANSEVRGSVEIVGSARLGPEFQFYKVEFASSATPDAWVVMGDIHRQEITNGTLEVWHTTALPDGAYLLHVGVVTQDGNALYSDPIRVQVANAQPAPTPTPAESPTPTATVFIPTPTTAIVEQPTVVAQSTATPPPTTGTGEGTPPSPTPDEAGTVSIPSAGVFARQCAFGGFVAAVLFIFAGAVVLLRRLI